MLHLCYSNHFEVLCAPLAARVHEAQMEQPLRPAQIIVPNPTVEQFIRFDIAEKTGVAANLHIRLLTTYLSELVQGTDPNIRILDRTDLQLLLFTRLQDVDFIHHNDLHSIERYLNYSATPSSARIRAFQLAGELARLFEEYSFSRRRMIAGWHKNQRSLGQTGGSVEEWQMRLWRAVFDKHHKVKRSTIQTSDPSQLSFFDSETDPRDCMMLVDALDRVNDRLVLPEALHIFGQSYVAPAFVDTCARLAEKTELYVYALNPCIEFWEDVQASGLSRLQTAWAHRTRNDQRAITEGDDPFELLTAQDTPALRLWGRPGREYVRLLNEVSHCEFASGFISPLEESDSVLAHLQHDILVREPERGADVPCLDVDQSIQILACPTLRREVEIVADSIWAAIEASSSEGQPLRFHEIAVLVAEADRDRYLAQIADIFAARDHIPLRLLDQNLSSRSAVFDLVQNLLDLPRKVMDRSAIAKICLHPNLADTSPLLQTQWSEWIDQTSVMFGGDADDHENTYLDGRAYHWTQALDRMVLGHFLPARVDGIQNLVVMDGDTLAPFETRSEDRVSLALFVQTIRDLLFDAKAVRAAELTLTDWGKVLNRLVVRYVHAEAPIDEVAMGRCMRCFERFGERNLDGQHFTYDIVHEMLTNEMSRIENSRGRHRADGVVVSTLLPMRALPFKHIYVLGLGEGRYPTVDSPNPLDLRQLGRHAGDVNPAERDRYLFLETILAARNCLNVSYVARDQITGEALSPSPVIRELEFVLRPYLGPDGVKCLTRHHPLVPWDPQYFEPAATHQNSWYANVTHSFTQLPEGWTKCVTEAIETGMSPAIIKKYGWSAPPECQAADLQKVSLSAIRGFLLSPLQQSAKTILGLYEHQKSISKNSEPVTMDPLARLSLLQTVFWSAVESEAELNQAYDLEFERLYLQNRAPAGPFATAVKDQDFKILKQWRAVGTAAGAGQLEAWELWALGPCEEDLQLTEQYPEISLKCGQNEDIKVNGVLERIHPDRHLMMTPILKEKPADEHFLRALISIIAARAGGIPMADTVKVIIPTASDIPLQRITRTYRVPTQDWALQWLTQIIEDLQSEFHPYRLPYEVVMNWYRARQENADAKPFLGPTQATRDDYGPIRNLSPFTLPDVERADAMVHSRFDLLFRMTVS
jgi:exodeoxyribonuclease V gamma subunit